MAWTIIIVSLSLASCSFFKSKNEKKDIKEMSTEEQVKFLAENNLKLNAKIEELEIKLAGLTDRVDSTKTLVENYTNSSGKVKTQNIKTPEIEKNSPHEKTNNHLSFASPEKKEIPTHEPVNASETKININELGEISLFKKGISHYKKNEYQDAILSFGTFVEEFPNHSLAGNAQFYLAESYFLQNEYKLALSEYKKIESNYSRSVRLPFAVQRIYDILSKQGASEDQLKPYADKVKEYVNAPIKSNFSNKVGSR